MSENIFIAVHVTPRSGRDVVSGVKALEQGGGGAACVGGVHEARNALEVHVRVTAPPDGGKANKAVCKLVATELGVPKSAVEVALGHTSRHKRLSVACDLAKAESWLSSLPSL